MFRTVVLRGQRDGSIAWSGSPAAELGSWTLTRDEHFKFTLSARVARADSFRLRQSPLFFVTPRRQKPAGLWCFPVLPKSLQVQGTSLTAALGPPEGR